MTAEEAAKFVKDIVSRARFPHASFSCSFFTSNISELDNRIVIRLDAYDRNKKFGGQRLVNLELLSLALNPEASVKGDVEMLYQDFLKKTGTGPVSLRTMDRYWS